MEIQKYFDQKKELYNQILNFLEDSESEEFSNQSYSNIIKNIKTQKIEENQEELEHFIGLIVSISNNHQRQPGFFNKIERILHYIKEGMKKNITNIKIYELFESNKRLLLFLIKEKIIIIDENIAYRISSKIEKNGMKYSDFFQPEINKFNIYEEKSEYLNNLSESEFEEKRLEGENDSYICSLIRRDSVEEFISFVNRSKISLSNSIENSIFETNEFLNEHETTLIEYAAFFGSIQIFQYLYLNNVKVDGSIWNFAIHSNNSILICHHIEKNHIEPIDKTYESALIESIKCHHNDISNYIENNLLELKNEKIKKGQIPFDERVLKISFDSYNYSHFPNDFDNNDAFFYLCQYNYSYIVNALLNIKKDFYESKIILKSKKILFNSINVFFYAVL